MHLFMDMDQYSRPTGILVAIRDPFLLTVERDYTHSVVGI